jgi:exodeoxyribonuclease VII small subunit
MSTNEKTLNHLISELDALLEWFDDPNIDIDQALEKFDEGVRLTETITKRLNTLENKITVLKERFDQETSV